MLTGEYTWTVQKAIPGRLRLRHKHADGSPVDFTGYTAEAEVWNQKRTVKYSQCTVEFEDRANGTVLITLPEADTLTTRRLPYFDLRLVPPVGDDIFSVRGPVNLVQSYSWET